MSTGKTRREFLEIGSLAILCGCMRPSCCRDGKFSVNASTLRGYGLTLLEQVKAVAASGFRGYEPWMKDIRAAKAAGELDEVCQVAQGGGVSFVNGIAFGQWVNPDPSIRKAGLEETMRDMELLAEMGCQCIAASMFGVQKSGSPIVPKEGIAERYAAVLDLGRKMGVRPLLEYWGHSVNLSRLEDALDVLKMLNRPDAAILADVYHTYRGGGSFETYRQLPAGTIPVLHVNDYPAQPPREQLVDADRVWPGDGVAPWKDIFGNLSAAGANPWLSIEVFNPSYWKTTPADTLGTGRRKLEETFSLSLTSHSAAAGCRMALDESPFTVNGIRIGVQMWSINDLWKKKPVDAFRRLKALGYDGVQSFGFLAMNHDELEKMLDDNGLSIIDMPFYMKTVAPGSFNRFLEFCQRFKIDFVFEPYAKFATGTEWRRHADELMALGEKFKPYGIRVGYHNHKHELLHHFDGKTPLEYLYDAGLAMELDVGHVKLAAGDPVQWLEKLNGRVPTIHAKPGGGNSVGGEGDANNWKAIFSAAATSGAKWAIVECETRRNTYADVEATVKFLKGLRD